MKMTLAHHEKGTNTLLEYAILNTPRMPPESFFLRLLHQWRQRNMPSLHTEFGDGDSLLPKHQCEFSSMMEIVRHNPPQYPLA